MISEDIEQFIKIYNFIKDRAMKPEDCQLIIKGCDSDIKLNYATVEIWPVLNDYISITSNAYDIGIRINCIDIKQTYLLKDLDHAKCTLTITMMEEE